MVDYTLEDDASWVYITYTQKMIITCMKAEPALIIEHYRVLCDFHNTIGNMQDYVVTKLEV